MGTPEHSITYPYPPLAIGSKERVRGVIWEQDRARGATGSEREQEGARGANRWLIGLLPLAPLAPSRSLSLPNEPPSEHFTS